MKKTITGVLGGVVLGVALIALVLFIFSFQSVGSMGRGQKPSESVSESVEQTETEAETETEWPTETETEAESETESEMVTETESESETETETETESESETNSESEMNSESEKNSETETDIPYYIKVNRAANCVTIYTKDETGAYTVPYKSMICSVGLNNRTPLGTYKISEKYKWRKLFGDDVDVYGYYTTRIVGHILFHSVPYTAKSNDMLWENQYNRLGSPASKGCIRLSVADAKWIYDNCRAGTIVEIYDDAENPGPLGRPEAIKIGDGSPYAGWDPTDPDVNNPWLLGKVTISGVKNMTIERGDDVDIVTHVSATDVDGLTLPVSVSTLLDVRTANKYNVIYTATGVTGKSATATAMITVKDTIKPVLTWKSGQMTLVINDETEQPGSLVQTLLTAYDMDSQGRTSAIDTSSIVVDTSALEKAMSAKAYGTYTCQAYATDASGNKSNTLPVIVVYEQPEEPSETESLEGTEGVEESEGMESAEKTA